METYCYIVVLKYHKITLMHSYITTHFPVLVKDTSIEIAGVKLVFLDPNFFWFNLLRQGDIRINLPIVGVNLIKCH